MNTHELLEYAVLDAHGMLDDDERRAFEQSFSASSSAVQSQIRREQARLVDLTGLLPEVEPAPELRARVIDAIRAEIRQETKQSAAFGEDRGRRVAHQPSGAPARGRLGMRRRVSSLWRAGSLGLAAACLVLTVIVVQLDRDYAALNTALVNDALVDQAVQTYSSEFLLDTLFDQQTERVVFTASDGATPGEMALFVNADWDHSVLYQRFGDAAGASFQVALVDDSGEVTDVVHEFTASSGLEAIRLPSIAAASMDRVRIIQTGLTDGAPIMFRPRSA